MTKLLSVRLDEHLVEALDAAVRAERRVRSDVVREALELWLEQRRTGERVARHRAGYERRRVTTDEFEAVLGAQRWPK